MPIQFCIVCCVAVLRPHPEQPRMRGWMKCPICGYCEKEIIKNGPETLNGEESDANDTGQD